VVHTVRDDDIDARDGYGQPVISEVVRTEVQGLIQPRTVTEIPATHDAGAEITDHRIYLEPMELVAADAIEDAGGRRYEIKGIRRLEFGTTPHLEVDAKLVGYPVAEPS
jgi:hypothetical protein